MIHDEDGHVEAVDAHRNQFQHWLLKLATLACNVFYPHLINLQRHIGITKKHVLFHMRVSVGNSSAISIDFLEKNQRALFMKHALKLLPISGYSVVLSSPVLASVNRFTDMRILT